MTPVRARRARAAAPTLVVLAAAVVLALAWSPSDPVPSASAPAPVDLGRSALVDSGFLGFPTRPPAPSGVSAVPHDRSALVSWSRATPSTSRVVSYRVYVGATQRGPDVPASQTSTTVLGLTNYQQQQITVQTYDSDGLESNTSTSSNSTPVTPFDDVAPSAVTGLVATRGDGRVTLTWEAESGVESDRAGVRVYADGTLRTSLPAATTTYDVTGLSNDVEHSFHLVAHDARPNGYGPPGSLAPNASAPSATVRATPTDLTPPSAPTGLTATRGDASAALRWTAPPESDVGSYEVVDASGALVASFPAPATSGTATALTNGRAHRLRLVAVDTRGNHSPASAEVTVTPATPPIARTGLSATRGDGQVALGWDARVADPAHAAATSLRVTVDGALVTTLPGTATSYTATGLTDDRAYAFSIVGIDDQGRAGPAATISATPTDLTAPSAPTGLTATRGDASAALRWTAPPESDVGSYLVLGQDGSTLLAVRAPATTTTLPSLSNGTAYRLRLVAVDTHGNRSTPTGAVVVTPLAPPLPVTGLVAPAKGSKVNLAWDRPASASDHADAVQVQVWRLGSPDQLLVTLPASQRSYQWTGYTSGASESFYVVALDGDPRPSERSALASTVLDPPTGVSATVESGRTRVAWETVVGASGYRVERVDGSGPAVVTTTSDAFLDVSGLTNGTAYTFRVLSLGASRPSTPSQGVSVTPLEVPVAVKDLRAERRGSDVVLSWTAPPPPPPGVAATTQVQVFRVGSPATLLATVDVTTATFTAADQPVGPRPRYLVVALDAHGRPSAASPSVTEVLPAPLGVSAVPGDSSAAIAWGAVAGAEGGYRVERLDATGAVVDAQPSSGTSLTVSGLTNGTTYRFRVVALPASGQESAPSAEVRVTVGHAPPTTVPAGGSGGAGGVAVSRDGRWVVTAVAGAGGRRDLVRIDQQDGTRVSIVAGLGRGLPLARTAISDDGRYVVLLTSESYDTRDGNDVADLYRYDVTGQAWAWVSAPWHDTEHPDTTAVVPGLDGSEDDAELAAPSAGPQLAITADGSRVFFLSARTDLVEGDADGPDLFSRDVPSGTTVRLTTADDLRPTGTGFAVTPNGSHVLYAAGPGSGQQLVRQATTDGARVRVVDRDGLDLSVFAGVGRMDISDDGQHVLAVTPSSVSGTAVDTAVDTAVTADLTPPTGPPPGAPDGAPATVRAGEVVPVDYGDAQVALSPDGLFAFVATKDALLPADTNGHVDVYRVELAAPSNRVLVTAGPDGGPAVMPDERGPDGFREWGAVHALTADRVVVVTQRPLIAADGNAVRDAYAVTLSAPPARRAWSLVGS